MGNALGVGDNPAAILIVVTVMWGVEREAGDDAGVTEAGPAGQGREHQQWQDGCTGGWGQPAQGRTDLTGPGGHHGGSHQGALLLAWITIHYKVWNKITCLFPNFNGAAVEVCEWRSNFISHFIGYVINYPL